MTAREFFRWWLPAVLIALALFALFPALDWAIPARFWGGSPDAWPLRWNAATAFVREDVAKLAWLPLVVIGAGALARAVGARLPEAFSLRAIVFLGLTYGVGPGLIVNLLLKNYWGRARPEAIQAFGGPDPYTPPWVPSDAGGASFVSGEVAIAAATCAVALLVHGRARAILFLLGFALASAIGMVRMAQGGHFLSDVVFAMLLTWLVAWVMHSLVFRWIAPAAASRTRDMEQRAGAP
jgi:lipid A 4'-phosphatase